jgi:hypothetical protein
MIKLNYLETKKDQQIAEFVKYYTSIEELEDLKNDIDIIILKSDSRNNGEVVFLLAIEQTSNNKPQYDEIFVFECLQDWNVTLIESYKDFLSPSDDLLTIFIQDYSSYEMAYKSALEMREPNPLCYER